MTTTTDAANAQAKLDRANLPHRIDPRQAGDDELVCFHDMVPVVGSGSFLRHSPAYLRWLRDTAARWPG